MSSNSWSKPRKTIKKRKQAKKATSLSRKRVSAPVSAQKLSLLRRPGLGNQLKRTLRYSEIGLVVDPGAAGAAASYYFSANGLTTPNQTAGGHQPMGFDEIMAFYDHYVVTNSRILIYCSNEDASYTCMVGVRLNDNVSSTTTASRILEQGQCQVLHLGNRPTGSGAGATNPSMGQLSLACNVGAFLGRKSVLSDPDLKGDAGSMPTEGVMFEIFGFPDDQTANMGNVRISIVIDYDVVFIEPKEIPQS